MYKKLITNTLIYGIAPQISRVISIFVLPFITPYLIPLDYGVFGVAMAVTGTLSVFSNLGLSYILMLYFYKAPHQYKWLWRQIYGFLKIWLVFFAIIQTVFLYVFLPNETRSNFVLIALLFALPYLFFSGAAFIGANLYRFSEKAKPIAIRTVAAGLMVVVLNLITIKYLHLGYLGWFISLAASELLSNILYYFPIHFKYKLSPIYNFKIKTIKIVLKKSFPLIPHYYSIYLLDMSDRLVMKILNFPTGLIGNYNVAANFGSYFSSLHMAIGQAIGPNIFKSIKTNNHDEANKIVKIYMFITFCFTLTFSIWCKEIIHFLIRNDELTVFYVWSIGIVMAYNYRPYYVLINQYLTYNERVKILPLFTFIPGIINLLLNFILMPVFGIQVAIYTTFGCYMLMGFMAFVVKSIRHSLKTNYYPLLTLFLITGSTLLCYYIVEQKVFLKVTSNLLLLILAYGFLRKFETGRALFQKIFKNDIDL